MFTIEIAGIPISIANQYSLTEYKCREYLSDRPAIFVVSAAEEDMEREVGYVSGYAESLCIYRRIVQAMVAYDGFLMHAAVIDVDGQGVAFAAKSGTGKTTRVHLWKRAMGDRVKIVNGDKPILRYMGDTLYAFGTPWMGKENWGENTSVPLKYVCFLERGEEVSLKKLKAQDVLPRLFTQVLVPKDALQADHFMKLMNRFITEADFFLLTCNMDKENPEQIWEQMQAEKWSQ